MPRWNKVKCNTLTVGGQRMYPGSGGSSNRPTGTSPTRNSAFEYFVDRNMTSGDGTSWASAFATLGEAIAKVNADYTASTANFQSKGRNRTIYVGEGWLSETALTLTASDVTIISVASGSRNSDGSVLYGSATAGGWDDGAVAPALTITGSANTIIGMGFVNRATGAYPAVSVGVSGSSGPTDNAFIDCFWPRDVADAYTYGLASYANAGTLVDSCYFSQSAKTGGILIATNGVTNPVGDRIVNSTFIGTPQGIYQNAGHNTYIADNAFMDATDDRPDTCDYPIVVDATSAYTTRNVSFSTNRADLCTGAAFSGGTALDLNNFGSDDTNT